MVLRKKPSGELLPSAHQVEREFFILDFLHQKKFPVPNPFALVKDSSVIGTPFYLMEFVEGVIIKSSYSFRKPNAFDALSQSQRQKAFESFFFTLQRLHSINVRDMQENPYFKDSEFYSKQISVWSRQYKLAETHKIEEMEALMKWLTDNASFLSQEDSQPVICHGDFKFDNVIFDESTFEVKAVLDWELSSIGRPMSDLSYSVLFYNFPSSETLGLSEKTLKLIMSKEECLKIYAGKSSQVPSNFYAYEAFSIFRLASILQGVYKRFLQGNASSEKAKDYGLLAGLFAGIGWNLIESNTHSTPKKLSLFDLFEISEEGKLHIQRLEEFIKAEIDPHKEILEKFYLDNANCNKMHPKIEEIKQKAKSVGLWNLFFTKEHGGKLTNLEYAFLAEKMGAFPLSSYFFNCSAPDTGNMELLSLFASDSQRKKFLKPLLEGEIRSCFAMTEPAVASSDPTNLQTTVKRTNEGFLVNGRKWWISGAGDPLCKFAIVMAKIDSQTKLAPHKSHSMIIVPLDSKGVKIIRPMTVFGYTDGPSCHCEIEFNQVLVPFENLVGNEGEGFLMAQARLGPGRLHHCMRLIGMAERALKLAKERAKSRKAFGKLLSEQPVVLQKLTECRLKIDQARLYVLFTAQKIDKFGVKASRKEVSGIKIVVPKMACEVIDEAIQISGALGLSQDSELPILFAAARTLRIADGPDDVHIRSFGKLEMRK